MRLRWVLIMFALGLRAFEPGWHTFAQAPPQGLVAAYGMNEGSGSTIAPADASGLTGAISGATWTTAGRFGGALTFDGVNDLVTVTDASALDLTTGMTLEAWVNPTAMGGGTWRNVLIKERPGGEVYNLYANADTNAPTVYVIRAAQPNTPLDARGTSQLPLNVWSHLAATFDNSTLRLYVNGNEVGARAISGPLLTSTGALRIGGNAVWGEFFAGRIDEVRLYNRALTPTEIQTDMNTPIGGPDGGAPVLSGGAPSGVLPAGTTQTTLSLVSNENANCRYATTAGVNFEAMPEVFAVTGGLEHTTSVGGLGDGGSYTFYVRCADSSNNTNASDYLIAFAVAQPGQDTTPPSVAITSPPDTASVAGMVSVIATASDNVGVAGVQILLDDLPLGAEVSSPPYSVVWDSSTAAVGPHTLTARARDAAGNATLSAPVAIVVANNPVPPNFVDEVVIGSGLTFPTAFEFLPDGRMLVTEFRGRILVRQPAASVVDPTPVVDLPNIFQEDVTAGGERGLVNVVADPDFADNGHIYVFYTAASPQRDRVSRLTMTGNTADPSSEVVIWQGRADSTSTDHHGGGLAFGPDGKLYISTGDNGDPPSAQPLSSDHGKLLRVNKDGTIPADNPFIDGNGPNVDETWARGLRNPYRFSWDPVTGKLYVGDVGQDLTEELNLGVREANYGWPTCEGPCGAAGITNPIFSYSHDGRDASITAGFVYRGTQFPAAYQGAFFYGDFAQNWIRFLTLNAAGNVTADEPFLPADGSPDGPYDPIMLKQGPDGSLYYVDFGWGWLSEVNPAAIRRIRYVAGNQPPVVTASATPTTGQAPLSVSFSSAGSFDPEGNTLSYAWTFGDGGTSSAPNPVHVYAQNGLYTASLEVSDGTLTSISNAIGIAVGSPPEQTITSPADGAVFRAGDVITFSGTASDPEDGPLPPGAFSWTVLFHHDTHVHPTLGPVSGIEAGTFAIPRTGHDFSGTTFYEIRLTTTDSTGLQTTSAVSVVPHKVNLTFGTTPAGLVIELDGVPRSTPFVKDTLTGFQHTIGAPTQAIGSVTYGFLSWSDGGAQTHSILAAETDASLAAAFQPLTVTASPTSATVLAGTLSSGNAASLANDDNTYYAVASTKTGTRTAAWYGAFVDIPRGLSNLRVNYKGNNSGNCSQTVAIWNWTTSAWTLLDSRTVGTTEVALNGLIPPGVFGDYVSGSAGNGELRVRVQCSSSSNRTSRGDLMSIVYDVPTGPDTSPPAVIMTAPADGATVSGSVAVSATATDNVGIVGVQFILNGAPLGGEDTSAPYSMTWASTNVADGGPYTLSARARDAAGNETLATSISVTVNNTIIPGLVAAYSFDDGAGSTLTDDSGRGHTGSVSGAAWTTQGRYGSALSFDGVDDWITVPDASDLDLTTAMTLEAWVYPTALGAGTWRNVIIKERPGGEVYNLYANVDTNAPAVYVVRAAQTNTPLDARGSSQLPLNTWSHLAMTFDNATLRLYVNGVEAGFRTVAGPLVSSAGMLRLGGNAVWGEYFAGRIDEVRIYDRMLSATEILSDMNEGIRP